MTNESFEQQIDEMRKYLTRSHRMLGSAPVPYREVITDAFSQIDTTLEELQVAEHELRQQGEALAESVQQAEHERHRYRNLFEFAPMGYVVTDAMGVILEANRAAAVLLNLEPRFLVKKPLAGFIHYSERSEFRKQLTDLRRTAYIPDWEVTIAPRNGEDFVASLMVSVEHDGSGAPECIRWLIRDATERKRAEQKILRLNRELEARVAERTAELEASVSRERHVTQMLIRGMLEEADEDAFPGLGVRTFYSAASHELLVGGDFFDAFALDRGAVAFVVGDVSGKGLQAASHTAEVKYTLRAYLRKASRPEDALTSLNEYLCNIQGKPLKDDPIFVVLAIAIVQLDQDEVAVFTAGSEPVLILRADGTAEQVHSAGLPLGIFPDCDYVRKTRPFYRGDRILLLTDGVTEARTNVDMLGIEGAAALAQEARHLPLNDAGQVILDGARAFAGDNLKDDACLVIAERRDPPL